jgi:hypothetical protein
MSDEIYDYTGPPIDFGTMGEVGETEIFQTLPEQEPQGIQSLSEQAGIDFGTMGEVGEADIFQTLPEIQPEVQESDFFVGPGGQVLNRGQELLAQNFPDQDPLSYDFYSALDQSYRFLSPQDMVPEGIEAVYGPTERDPFRQDWSEAEFRVPVDYEGEFLTGDEMNVVQNAYDFVGSLALEAQDAGYTSTRDYLAAMQEYEPGKYNAIATALNSSAGVIDQYGDQYKFQAALHDAEQISVDPMEREDIIRSSMDLLRDYVAAGLVSQEEAAYLAQDPVGLISLISSGDFTPQAIQTPSTSTTPTETTTTVPETTTTTTPTATTTTTPTTTPEAGGPTAFSWGDVTGEAATVDSDAETPADTQTGIGAVDGGAGQEEATTTEEATTEGGITEVEEAGRFVDAEGRTVVYADWDEDRQFPFVRDPYSGRYDPPLEQGQEFAFNNDGTRRFIVDTDGNIVREVSDYPDYFDAPPGLGVERDDGIDPGDLPRDSQGVYDLQTDYERSGEDILGMYFTDDGSGLGPVDLQEELRTGFRSTPVFDPSVFREVSEYEYNLAPDHLKVQRSRQVTRQVPRRFGMRIIGYDTVTETVPEYYIASAPLDQIEYEDQNIFANSFGSFSNPHVQSLYYPLTGYSESQNMRVHRVFTRANGMFNWYLDLDHQEFILEKINDYIQRTGKSLSSVANQTPEDIQSGAEDPDTFDVQQFVFGDDDGWEGIFSEFQEEFPGSHTGTETDADTRFNLNRWALITAGLAEPINSRIEQEYNSRISGSDFGNNSIPTAYMEMFGPPTAPDYLQTFLDLSGPEDEPQGLFAEGGYIGGIAGGMDDTIPASIDGSQPAALSSGEFVVPADVVSHLGDGNNQNGAAKLYNFMDQVRTVKTGSTEQPDPLNDGIMANMIGEPYGQ